MPPLEGKVAGRSYYPRFYLPGLHSLTLCQPRCEDAHRRGTRKNKASCRTLLSRAPANNLQQRQRPSSRHTLPPSACRPRLRGRGGGERGSELALVLVTARRNVFSKCSITSADKQPSMHMSMHACAQATHSHSHHIRSPDRQAAMPKGGGVIQVPSTPLI